MSGPLTPLRTWLRRRRAWRSMSPAARLVARRGIVAGSTQGDRSSNGSRFPEEARLAAQKSIRAAMRRVNATDEYWDQTLLVDREPLSSDGPDYHEDHAAWRGRNP